MIRNRLFKENQDTDAQMLRMITERMKEFHSFFQHLDQMPTRHLQIIAGLW